jgi:hypothetical protein
MLTIEQEAKKKLCHQTLQVTSSETIPLVGGACIVSVCMGWRWFDPPGKASETRSGYCAGPACPGERRAVTEIENPGREQVVELA